jgi:hypothetical protein
LVEGDEMTINEWILIAQAVTAGLLLGGGFWLRYFVKHQVDAKDATIQSLQAAHGVYEARISSLESQRAPELAKELLVMMQLADQTAKEKRELSERVNNLTAEQKESQKLKPLFGLMYEIEGLTFASETFKEAFTAPRPTKQVNVLSEGLVSLNLTQAGYSAFTSPIGDIASAIIGGQTKIQKRIESRLATIKAALKTVPPNTM